MTSTHVLVIADPASRHLSVLGTLPEGVKLTTSLDPEVLRKAAPEAEVVLNGLGKGDILEAIWPQLKKLSWVHSMAAGVENVLFPALRESEIPLTNARGVYRESLGEFVVAAALYFAKDLRRMVKNQEAGVWDPFDIEELYKQTMGVIGYGELGKAGARRAKALGMRILATRRRSVEKDEILDEVFPIERRGEMLAQCDVVVVAAPLTPETRGIIGQAELAAMKPGAIIINIGRGPVIDEKALIDALRERRIRGAALDVFDQEPLPEGHPFWTLDNVLLSPHCADHTSDWLEQSMEFFVRNFKRWQAGEELHNLVDKQAGY